MNKISVRVTPTVEDYFRVLKLYSSMRETMLSALRGFAGSLILFMLVILVIYVSAENFQGVVSSLIILLIFSLLFFSPNLSGWLTARKVSKQSQLLQPVTYEFDDERIYITNKLAGGKSDWSAYSEVLETKQYYFLLFSTHKNMFQFLPKRAFESLAQESDFRSLIERKVGKIDNIQKSLRGWLLSLLVAILTISIIALSGLVYFSYFLRSLE